jgi:hypothetical protein
MPGDYLQWRILRLGVRGAFGDGYRFPGRCNGRQRLRGERSQWLHVFGELELNAAHQLAAAPQYAPAIVELIEIAV